MRPWRERRDRREREWLKAEIWLWVVGIVVGYVVLAEVAYAFRHPELTDTQRLINFWDALTWR